FSKYNGNLGENGCVAWMFSRSGMILVAKDVIEEDELMELVLENGAEDMKTEEEHYEVVTSPEDFHKVVEALKEKELPTLSAEIEKIPSTSVKLEGKHAEQMLKLTEKIEELDDVQDVWSNFDISEEEIEAFHSK
ncbi:MAG: YebC/PmpR family DNA-binding transcriptional regulator, partial [bacterium]|nr:YebC/PmpR family DNA-binding transcriptional regulator [bacterium]